MKSVNQGFTNSSQKNSTHLLTVLTIGVILQLEQRKGNKKERTVPAGGSKRKLIQMASMSRKNGGMTYVNAQRIW